MHSGGVRGEGRAWVAGPGEDRRVWQSEQWEIERERGGERRKTTPWLGQTEGKWAERGSWARLHGGKKGGLGHAVGREKKMGEGAGPGRKERDGWVSTCAGGRRGRSGEAGLCQRRERGVSA
jgi:hypothetical protein